jgi:hypothetical protein
VEQPKTDKNNFKNFMVQNGLGSVRHQLPKVILDAVRFLEAFGE